MARIAPPSIRVPGGLEQVVRPFVNARPVGERARFFLVGGDTPSEPASEPEEGFTFAWRAKVETTTIDAMGWSFTVDLNEDEDELTRSTSVRRIMGDDGESFVDVEVIDSISFKDRRDGTTNTLRLNN